MFVWVARTVKKTMEAAQACRERNCLGCRLVYTEVKKNIGVDPKRNAFRSLSEKLMQLVVMQRCRGSRC